MRNPRAYHTARKSLRVEPLEDRRLLAGLVSWWTADNTAADAVGTNHGTLVSGATYAPGHVGQAFSFDGVDDRVQVADSPSLKLTQSLTIEAWLRVDSFSTTSPSEILFRGDDRGGLDPYKLQINPDGTIALGITPTSGQGVFIAAPAPIGQFFHVAATLDGATGSMRLYINGVVKAQTTTTIRPFGDLDPTKNPSIGIGNHGGWPAIPNNLPFHGLIDELKAYDVSLSPTEVLANYNASIGGPLPSITISDATAIEGSNLLKLLDQFVAPDSGGLLRPRQPAFGPDSNGDGIKELYLASADTDEILRYDGSTGAFLDAFIAQGSGGLDGPADLEFAPDGSLYVSGFEGNHVLRYDGQTGAFLNVVASGLSGNTSEGRIGPLGLSFKDGALYIGTHGSGILRYDPSGLSIFVPAGSGGLSRARHAVFGPDGNGDGKLDLYVASDGTGQVLLYDGLTGAFIDVFVTMDAPPAPWIEFGPDGDLYVLTLVNSDVRITRFDTQTRAVVSSFSVGPSGLWFILDADNILYNPNGFDQSLNRYGPSSLAVFTVSLSSPSAVPITVNLSTANGAALAGVDYISKNGNVTFAPGQTTQTILVQTLSDSIVETSETFTVNLSNAVGGIIADGQGVGTIENNRHLSGDYDGNGLINDADHAVWRASFGQIVLAGTVADGNANGVVDAGDYVVWRTNVGAINPPQPSPGDYNNSSTVDVQDYAVWWANFGSRTNLAADGNGDGVVDAVDYIVWRNILGATAVEPSTTNGAASFITSGNPIAPVDENAPAPSTGVKRSQIEPKPGRNFSAAARAQTFDNLNLMTRIGRAAAATVKRSRLPRSIDPDGETSIESAFGILDNERWSDLAEVASDLTTQEWPYFYS